MKASINSEYTHLLLPENDNCIIIFVKKNLKCYLISFSPINIKVSVHQNGRFCLVTISFLPWLPPPHPSCHDLLAISSSPCPPPRCHRCCLLTAAATPCRLCSYHHLLVTHFCCYHRLLLAAVAPPPPSLPPHRHLRHH